MNKEKLSPLLWLWVPVAAMIVQVALDKTLSAQDLVFLYAERGPHEIVQFLVIGAAFCVAAFTLLLPGLSGRNWLRAWIGLAAVCCFYVAGEEISWGQHFFQWVTPENWQEVNDQNETNLHNTSSWLDQKPRAILQLGIFVGGLVIPFLLRFRPAWLPQKFAVIYPSYELVLTAVFLATIKLLNFIDRDLEGMTIFGRGSEVSELYMFYFVLLYMVVLRLRVLQNQR
ncbi:MAG: hypothetical protein IT558_03135 [Alphaproteobacteria bacterium]|nr:hypothetical protein [Alphaproteobacteria bacterium]